jgi:hypothetical protein
VRSPSAGVALAFALVAAPAGAADAPDPGVLRAALVRELRAVPGDDVGAAASAYLASPKVAFAVRTVSGRPAEAAYLADSREIIISERYAREAGAGVDVETFARRIAATLVHEVEHAVDLREAAAAPKMREGELAAYGAEAVFLRRRLARDADYAGLAEMDRIVRRRLKLGPPDGPWWRRPIPEGEERRYRVAAEDHARIQYWYLVRAAAAGMAGVERAFDDSALPNAARACASQPPEKRRSCRATAELLTRRVARFSALLESDPLAP